jgi:acyl-CoA dehydrogenase
MEVLLRYGTQQQRDAWLDPLLDGQIRSGFAMTEPDVASSDATTMAATAVLDGDDVVINGRKWWTTGAGHPDCAVFVLMARTENPDADRHHQHTMVLVPRDTPGVEIVRMLPAMGRYDEPLGHGEVLFRDARVPRANILLGEGRAFEIAQGRLGPGRVHHCMRLIGLAEMALERAVVRGRERVAFGKPLIDLGGNRERVARARIAINSARLLVLHAAWTLDTAGPLGAISEVSQIKVAVPSMAQEVIDFAMQMHGGAGMSDDVPLAAAWTHARSLRLADGPDEVHLGLVARLEVARHVPRR